MEGVGGWYVILGIAFLVMALVARFSVYTFLVHQSRWLPERAQQTANFASGLIIGAGLLLLGGKALFFSR